MADASSFEVGQTIELNDGRIAVVRFAGSTHFAPGDWLGVELGDSSGKNDGAVQGERYFECLAGHGMFVRPSVAVSVDVQASKAALPPRATKRLSVANGGALKGRPTSQSNASISTKRQSIIESTAKRKSVNAASPTPVSRPPGAVRSLRSPSKSPTKQLASRPSSIGSSRSMPPPASTRPSLSSTTRKSAATARQSIAPSSSTASASSRLSISTKNAASSRPAMAAKQAPPRRLSTLQQRQRDNGGSTVENSQNDQSAQASPNLDQGPNVLSPASEQGTTSPTTLRASARPGRPGGDFGSHGRPGQPNSRGANSSDFALNRELDDLKTKVKLMDKRHFEDRERLTQLDKTQEERDKFRGIIDKLQAKLQPQQQEMADLRRQVKEAETRLADRENQRMDVDTAVEMATLDREMAEETAEAYKLELDVIRSKYEELELEVEILREENSELGKEMTPEERTSQGWLQMERNNERLKEALLRLRDMTQDKETELESQIEDLQADNADLEQLRKQHEETKIVLSQSENLVEDLRQQLDNALGAEEMIEDLTEKNMSLAEHVDELKVAVDDLENLKELNDELELNHIENEKQLQDEIEYHEALNTEQTQKLNMQDETIVDLEYTISRFRELVANLQSDLEDMRASQELTEHEATELSSKSKAMMDLNLRLQASASKAQNKAIEMELGKLEAQEAMDHLKIVQCFLPESYIAGKDSINTYLRIKRIAFKANLLHTFVKERASGVAVLGREEDTFAACMILDELVWISCMCQRFVKFIGNCSLEAFEKLGAALYDLEPVERTLNGWVDSLKREDLKETQCASELRRSIAIMSHLGEVHIPDDLQQRATEIEMRALMMQSRLENSATTISQIKAISQARVILPADADEEDEALAESFIEKANNLISQLRSSKVIVGKAVQQLQELGSRSLTIDPSTESAVEESDRHVREFAEACQSSASGLVDLVNQETTLETLGYHDICKAMSPQHSSPFSSLSTQLHKLAEYVQAFHALTNTLSQMVEFSIASTETPWFSLSKKLKAEASASALYEKEVLRLKDELSEKSTTVAIKDKAIDELKVNVEVLLKRVSDLGGRKERLKELELKLESALGREQHISNKVSALEEALRMLESEREEWSNRAPLQGLSADIDDIGTVVTPAALPPSAHTEIEDLKAQLERTSHSMRRLHGASVRDLCASNESWLAEPLSHRQRSTASRQLSHESKDVLKSLLDVVNSTSTRLTPLKVPEIDRRLAWRPASESLAWSAGKQREVWEAWRDWQRNTSNAYRQQTAHGARRKGNAQRRHNAEVSARIGVSLPWSKTGIKEITIAGVEEWVEVERELGVA